MLLYVEGLPNMKKRICLLIVAAVCAPLLALAQDAPRFFAEDFLNQTVILSSDGSHAKQCQAVRILPKWYLTAAHCVRPYCDKECRITFSLIQGNLQASADVYHSSSEASVFVPRQYRPGTAENIRYDIALVRFDPRPEDYFFYEASSKEVLDEKTFLKKLKGSAYRDQYDQWEALKKARPKLLVISDTFDRLVQQPLAVPDLRQSGIFFKDSKDKPFYYFSKLRHYLGLNFGVEKGMSGSGVVLPGGHIIGVVSASLTKGAVMPVYDDNDRQIAEVPYSAQYFLFTPISRQNASFINATVSSFHEAGRKPDFATIDSRYAEKTDTTLETAFGGALTVREVLNSKEKK